MFHRWWCTAVWSNMNIQSKVTNYQPTSRNISCKATTAQVQYSVATTDQTKHKVKMNKIYVFAKLETFRKARNDVLKQLGDVFKQCKDVTVADYEDYNAKDVADAKTVTVVAVLDKRQTRCLITPSRRDANIDHWDDFKEFYTKTKPHGSILVVIYGDELSGTGVVDDSWSKIWRFNDQNAYELTLKDRCFSLPAEGQLTDAQKETLKNYIDEIEKYPLPTKAPKLKVLSYGGKQGELLTKYLTQHRLCICKPTQGKHDLSREIFENIFPKEISGKESPRADLWFTKDSDLLKVCGDVTVLDAIGQFISNVDNPVTNCEKLKKPSQRRIVVFCHCLECFTNIMELSDKDIYKEIKKELKKFNVAPLEKRLFPIIPRDVLPKEGEDSDPVRKAIKNAIDTFVGGEQELNDITLEELADLYVFYLCTPRK
ncbi:uncharacterized protein LOC144451596 isoform X2 [Glandiceps talaboti]